MAETRLVVEHREQLWSLLAELPPAGRPLGCRLQHPPGAAHAGGRHLQPGGAQPPAHQLEAAALLAEPVGHRHPAAAEHQLAVVVAAV